MTSSAPTILALEIDSAWVVILAVSLITLPLALGLRRMIGRVGGLASGLLLICPLALPLVAGIAFERGLLPELGVLRPVGHALNHPEDPAGLLFFSDGRVITPYTIVGSAGYWLLIIGISVSSFMMIRRLLGKIVLRRLVARSTSPAEGQEVLADVVASVGRRCSLRRTPTVLVLPAGVPGAFAVGGRSPKILISPDVLEALDERELEAIVAHEIAHIEARDVELVFSAGMLRDLVAWNPLSHMAFRRLVADRELEADRRATQLTGEPLALASGLLKVCDLMKTASGRPRAALAAARPGMRLTPRVNGLLAVADGHVSVPRMGRLPYLVAAALVSLLGLQAGARLAAQDPAALAFVLGDVNEAPTAVWSPNDAGADSARAHGIQARKARKGMRYVDPLAAGIAFREKHMAEWMQAVGRLSRRSGLSKEVLQWEMPRGWQATPLVSGPIGIYTIEPR